MNLLRALLQFLPYKTVYAHCDIPCGIYDPHTMQMAAHSVIRMNELIGQLRTEESKDEIEKEHKLIRYTKVKEDHAEIVKHEVRVLYGDYFKEEHLKEYPELQGLVFKTLKLASKARQNIDLAVSEELLVHVGKIAEIFFKTKNRDVARVKSVYPTEREIVQPI